MKMKYNSKCSFILYSIVLVSLLGGCKKWIDVDPPSNQYSDEFVYSTKEGAVSAITGIYISLQDNSNSFVFGSNGITVISGYTSDEFVPVGLALNDYYFIGNVANSLWKRIYGGSKDANYVFRINSIIEGVSSSKTISEDAKKILLGEAKFLRAFCYFYLVNLYGDVPLALTTDFKINSSLSRTQTNAVYAQIIADLKDAQSYLPEKYLEANLTKTTTERVRPNKSTASALLSRIYLYLKDWSNAELEASRVIENSQYSMTTLDKVFFPNNSEAIWQLQTVRTNDNFTIVADTRFFIPRAVNRRPNVQLSPSLIQSFDDGDQRKNEWTKTLTVSGTNYIIPYKYKSGLTGAPATLEYPTIFRLSEQFLIRAEARANQDKLSGNNSAESDLNVIRRRAGLDGISNVDRKEDVLFAIERERQVELFAELGARWLDLKRTKRLDQVMPSIVTSRGISWNANFALYALPVSDLKANPHLSQNPGYSLVQD